jgi:histone acetyltransferase
MSSKGLWVRCVLCCVLPLLPDVRRRSDLNTMEHKLETNQYPSLRGFIDDAQLIFDNCRLYNPEGSVYAKNATRMEKFLKDQVAERMRTEA